MLLVPDGGGNSVQVGIGLVGLWGEEGLVGEGCHVAPCVMVPFIMKF